MVCVVSAQPWKIKQNPEVQKKINSLNYQRRYILGPPIIKVDTHPTRLDTIKSIQLYQPLDLKKYGILTPEEIKKGYSSLYVDRLNPLHLTSDEMEMQYIYNVFFPALIKNDSLSNDILAQLPIYRDTLYSIVISKRTFFPSQKESVQRVLSNRAVITSDKRMHKDNKPPVNKDIEVRSKALLSYAVISEAHTTIELVKQFVDRGYGAFNGFADSYAIMTCLMLGEEGERYLRELAKQRENEGLTVSSGWAYVKNIMPNLELSDDLIGNYEEERIDANELEEWKSVRVIVQEKLNHVNKK